MKTMKKFLAAAMAVTSIMAFAPVSAFAENDSTSVTFDAPHVSPEFIITIPQSVTLSSSASTATITATDVYLDTEKHTKINVTLDSASNTEDGNTFHAVNTENGSSATYTINNGNEANIAVGDTVAEFTEADSQTLTFSAPTGATYAGTHTEVLTFGIRASNQYLDAAVNDVVHFGNYDWYVIGKDTVNNSVTLLMKTQYRNDILYHNTAEDVTWATCTARTYLNSTFYNSFTNNEKARIAKTTIHTNDNGNCSGGEDTEDYIYLLSIEEAEQLDPSVRLYAAEGSEYGHGWIWYLRSPGKYQECVAVVDSIGRVNKDDNASVLEWGRYLRPALTLKFD